MTTQERLRIGELSRRVGLSEHVLRAWERRYGVLRPERTAGGFRLYSPADEQRVRRMQQALGEGLSTAEAARLATVESSRVTAVVSLAEGASRLSAAVDDFDAPGAEAALDDLLAGHPAETVVRDVVLPFLHEVGCRWERGELDVTREHFASNLLRGKLGSLTRSTAADAPVAVLACPPGELHDLPLLLFGVALNRRGWRPVFLGADVPVDDLTATARDLAPDLVVLAAASRGPLEAVSGPLLRLAQDTAVAIGGAGATADLAERTGAVLLTDDPITAAGHIASGTNLSPEG
ncbi:MAG TPA: MerR family transcriptional regulator [Nocardioidaceae bacterium]